MPVKILETKYEAVWKEEPKLMHAVADYGFGHTFDIPLPQHYFPDDHATLELSIAEGMESLAKALLEYADQLRSKGSGAHPGNANP